MYRTLSLPRCAANAREVCRPLRRRPHSTGRVRARAARAAPPEASRAPWRKQARKDPSTGQVSVNVSHADPRRNRRARFSRAEVHREDELDGCGVREVQH
eukprot:6193997-Pleurochrysis_carterae.AAC.4